VSKSRSLKNHRISHHSLNFLRCCWFSC